MSQERALQRTWGRAEWGHASGGDPGGLAGGSGLGQGLGYDLLPGPKGCYGHVGVSRVLYLCFSMIGCLDLCVQMYLSLLSRVHVEMFAFLVHLWPPLPTTVFACGHICVAPCFGLL